MTTHHKNFNIQYQAIFSKSNKNTIKVWLSEPLNFKTQKIGSILISHKPKNHYKDVYGNKILYFEFKNGNDVTVQIDLKLTLYKRRANLIKENIPLHPYSKKLLSLYTKSEKFLEQTTAVKKLTSQITENDKSILDKICSILRFLEKNFKYTYPIKKRGVNKLNLSNLRGDCGEVGALFVTMCRILKIPAINKTGYVIYHDELNNIYEHGWCSVYLNSYGWIDIDPLAKNISNRTNDEYLYHQKNYFLTFTNGFNIKIAPAIPSNFEIGYWNNLGLPLNHTSVQTLQPLIFASKNETDFSENIKINTDVKSPD